MKEKNHNNPHHDPVTRGINDLINRIPKLGSSISRIYLWRYMMFNVMIVGASGMVLSFLLYEGIFRALMIAIWRATILGLIFPWGATFLGMILTSLLVFFWNYFWNMHWSLSTTAQINSMSKGELIDLQEKIQKVLSHKKEDSEISRRP